MLNAQIRNGAVKCVINGEDFNLFNFKALELKNKYKELEQLLKVCNHGVTIVEMIIVIQKAGNSETDFGLPAFLFAI